MESSRRHRRVPQQPIAARPHFGAPGMHPLRAQACRSTRTFVRAPIPNFSAPVRYRSSATFAIGLSRIGIANLGGGGGAHTDVAIDQEHRAVRKPLHNDAA
jgi:hypothetical protein